VPPSSADRRTMDDRSQSQVVLGSCRRRSDGRVLVPRSSTLSTHCRPPACTSYDCYGPGWSYSRVTLASLKLQSNLSVRRSGMQRWESVYRPRDQIPSNTSRCQVIFKAPATRGWRNAGSPHSTTPRKFHRVAGKALRTKA
jgi:hypothetical protein